MGPTIYSGRIWPPIEPADRPPGGELATERDKDRHANRQAQRRKHRDESNPDADEFAHAGEEPEAEDKIDSAERSG